MKNPLQPKNSSGPAPKNPRLFWAILALLAAASIYLSLARFSPFGWLDDAFISFRYARNLVEGRGLVYNAGEAVEGYTNFLWTLAAALALRLRIEPVVFAQGISLAANAGTLALLFRLGRRQAQPGWIALLGPALLALHISFISYPMSGMESSFFTLCLLGAVYFLSAGQGPWWPGAAFLALLALTRFDGAVLAGVLLAYLVLVEKDWRKALPPAGVLALVLVLYNLWRLQYYGALLPNTFFAKVGFSTAQVKTGLRYVGNYLVNGGGWWLLPFTVAALLRREKTPAVRLSAWVVVWQLVYIIAVGGDWMRFFRFVLPLLPLMFFLLQTIAADLTDALCARFGSDHAFVRLAPPAALALALGLSVAPYLRPGAPPAGADFFRYADAPAIGRYLDQNLAPEAGVAIEWGGIIPYYLDRYVLETFGLADREIVRGDFPPSRFGRLVPVAYIGARGLDLVVPCVRLFPGLEAALQAVQDGGACDYRDYLRLAGSGYRICVMRAAPEGYWPVLLQDSSTDGALCANQPIP